MDDALSMIRIMVVVGVGVASGCASDAESWTSTEDALQIEACHGQVTDPVDAFTLSSVTRSGDDLLVDVQAGGGCKPHRFAVCWNGLAALSAPPQVGLELTHDAHDPCLALLSFQLRIDTSSLRASGLTPVIVRVFGQRQDGEPLDTATLID
jgi:hypothetical protein